MESVYKINFSFPFNEVAMDIKVEAVAEQHSSETYYIIHSFRVTQPAHLRSDDHTSFLPVQEIMCINVNGESLWVHKDAKRATELSVAIGEAIIESIKD
ncbi:MAG: hypothetical protein ACTHJ5_18520 [Ilyomonas sp.]